MLPVDLGGKVFPVSGGLPLAKRAPQRQAYRLVELKRFSEYLHAPLNLQPKYFPVAGDDAAQLIIAVDLNDGADAAMHITDAVLRAVWVEERNIADEATLAALLARARAAGAAPRRRALAGGGTSATKPTRSAPSTPASSARRATSSTARSSGARTGSTSSTRTLLALRLSRMRRRAAASPPRCRWARAPLAQRRYDGPLFDAHLHYNDEARRARIRWPTCWRACSAAACARSSPTAGPTTARRRWPRRARPTRAAGVTVVPFVRLYRNRADYSGWFGDESIYRDGARASWRAARPPGRTAASASSTSTTAPTPTARSRAKLMQLAQRTRPGGARALSTTWRSTS